MKVLALILVIAFVCVVLFVAGVFSPGRSQRLQDGVRRISGKAEKKGDERGGRVGDMTRDAFKKSRHAADRSSEKGREIHDKIARH